MKYHFFSEVIEILGNKSIKMANQNDQPEFTEENVIEILREHEKYGFIYKNDIDKEIDFVSSHFYNLCETHQEDLKTLNNDTLYCIISNSKLRLKNEDQLVKFLNNLYNKSKESNEDDISDLYEFVIFSNIEEKSTIEEFIEFFDNNDLTKKTWISCPPSNVAIYEDSKKWFCTIKSLPNNWPCFEFKENRIAPTHTIWCK